MATSHADQDASSCDDDANHASTRRSLRAALARGRAGTVPTLMRSHCLPVERMEGGVVVRRLMLAPDARDGREHAVPITIVHCERFVTSDSSDGSETLPLVCFMHGTGGDTEALVVSQLVPFARRGYVALGVDAPCHGRRLDPMTYTSAVEKINKKEKETEKKTRDEFTRGSHVSLTRSRGETFELYGRALCAAWNGKASYKKENNGYAGDARPFLYDGAWDALRAITFVTKGDARVDGDEDGINTGLWNSDDDGKTAHTQRSVPKKPRIDPTRVGIAGVSLGGMYSWFAAAAAPDLVTGAVAPLIGVSDFAWGLANGEWEARVGSLPPHVFDLAMMDLSSGKSTIVTSDVVTAVYEKITPGLLDSFDGRVSLPAISPRPLLVLNGEHDPRNPLVGVQGVVEATRLACEKRGVSRAFTALAQINTNHECTPEMLRLTHQWLDATLRPAGRDASQSQTEVVTKATRDSETWRQL